MHQGTTRPQTVIGISGANRHSESARAIIAKVQETGALPFFIDGYSSRNVCLDLASIAALIVMGNSDDIDPAYYVESAHEKTCIETDKARARYEFAMLAAAIRNRMPVLGICGGMQRINVMLGGTLHQHVPELVGGDIIHNQLEAGIPVNCAVEVIHIVRNTHLAALAQGTLTAEEPFMENSLHHQAVNRLGKGLREAAISFCGTTEAIEADPAGEFAHQFLLGVQWHPEFDASPLGARIIGDIVAAAHQAAN